MFFAVYIACGITDMIDGPVARRMGKASSQGARLDSAADFVFVVVCLAKILPVFALPVWAYLWIGGIALLKAASMVVGYRHEGSAALPHTKLNKATGLALFVLPLVFMLPAGALQVCVPVCIVGVCVLATCAAIQEHLFTCR